MYPVLLTFCPQSTLRDLGNQYTHGSFLLTDRAIVGATVHLHVIVMFIPSARQYHSRSLLPSKARPDFGPAGPY
ncbi:uncharacterized protein ARMOST_02386 [Armillaria ostoyae]|uniref:Uncharacterized protein n=1 Tax=Armillaria ostoyae TaxID=47428 RepID=A0A284QRJ8_ARMOS|nr:uncharacterized protein ARMOST_02386 [Armillaria ostoyae]